jgi:glycine/D-amino acid oxidase-like deaminating enzyme
VSETEATAIDPARGIVRTKTDEIIQSDRVVVAAGAWTAKLFPDLVKRLTPIRSIAIYAAPPPELAAAWAAAPCTMIVSDHRYGHGTLRAPPRRNLSHRASGSPHDCFRCGGRMFKFAPLLGEDIAAVLGGIAATTRLDLTGASR